jgi:photosystem II stability/assembly factor-like uncharacterized protein
MMYLRSLAILAMLMVSLFIMAPVAANRLPSPSALARQAPDWELLQSLEPGTMLSASSESLFIQHGSNLWVRESTGDTAVRINLPEGSVQRLAVHPRNPNILYVSILNQLYRSIDGGQQWSVVLTTLQPILVVRVSPADPSLIYVGSGSGNTGSAWRSDDGGVSWERLHRISSNASPCTFGFHIAEPDPVVRDRIFLEYGCYAGRNFSVGFSVAMSDDAWTTNGASVFSSVGRNSTENPLVGLYPLHIAFESDRLHGIVLADRNPSAAGGTELLRTIDGGRSWDVILAPRSTQGASATVISTVVRPGTGLDQLLLGLSGAGQGVLWSRDSGSSWVPIGRRSIGAVGSLAYIAASDTLYAATDTGLWRIHGVGASASEVAVAGQGSFY